MPMRALKPGFERASTMKPLHFAILTVLLAAWGLFAVEQRVRTVRHGYSIQHLEYERRKLIDDNRTLQSEIAALMRPERIASEVRRLGLPLVDPVEAEAPEARQRPQYAGVRQERGTP